MISFKQLLNKIVFQTGIPLIYNSITTLQKSPVMLHKHSTDICIYLLNNTLGPNTTNTILKHIDISIPLMQYYMFGSSYKTNEYEDLAVALTAASVIDSNSNDAVVNGTTFKTAIKDPIKIFCKNILMPEASYPFIVRAPGCEFLGVMSANIIIESYNKGSIFVNYTKLALKTLPDAIAKPSASLVKKSSIKDLGFDYVSAETIYRLLSNNGKIFLDYIINPKKLDHIPNQEHNLQNLLDIYKNFTPIKNNDLYIISEEECPIPHETYMLGSTQDELL